MALPSFAQHVQMLVQCGVMRGSYEDALVRGDAEASAEALVVVPASNEWDTGQGLTGKHCKSSANVTAAP
jgi:hypothetical protein